MNRKRRLTGKMCKLYDKYCYVNHFWCDEVNAEDCYIRKAYEQGRKDEIEKAYEKFEEANTNYEYYDVISQYWDWIEKERKRLKK